jgi:MFS family permease
LDSYVHEIVDRDALDRRWWVLGIVLAAQFIFGLDAFIVNVALPTIASQLHASSAQLEAVIAVYFIGYATLVITGGRLGDIYGTRTVFMLGVLGFTATSLWCGLAQSAAELVGARLAQGATAALMVPQVLATLHTLFSDDARARAFGIYGIALGLAGAAGFVLGGVLVTADLASLSWRVIFFVNVPIGIAIIAAALALMPGVRRSSGAKLDIPGALTLFTGLLCLIGSLLLGNDLNWPPGLWGVMAVGLVVIYGFVRLELRIASRGGMPLIDTRLLQRTSFMRGLTAVFWFFFANLSFYLVATLFLQTVLHISPLRTGLLFLPAAFAFVIAAQHSGARGRRRGTLVLIEGCAIQLVALAAMVACLLVNSAPPQWLLVILLTAFGYGQGYVMAPLSSAVLAGVNPNAAGAAAGMYATTTQSANAAGVAAVGAVYFNASTAGSASLPLLLSLGIIALAILASAALLTWMRGAMRSP